MIAATPVPHADPPLVRVATHMADVVNRASGDRPYMQEITSRPRLAVLNQTGRVSKRRMPGCPLGLPGLPPWKQTWGRSTIRCVLAYRTHAMNVRIVYLQTPAKLRADLRIRVAAL